MYENNDKKLLQYPITLVEIIFAVVIGASILRFSELLFPPAYTTLNFWALIVAYFTAITSWFGWHKSTNKYPYTDSGAGRLRSSLDAFIVAVYVALLFFGSKLDELFSFYLWGFVLVFFLYLIAGELRRIEYHDVKASQVTKIVYHLVASAVVAIAFTISTRLFPQYPEVVSWIFVFLPLATVASFRWFREWHELQWTEIRTTIGVDMDGVLVEQVIPVLAKLKHEMNVDLCKCDITDWQFPIRETNIKNEIEKAERDEQYVKTMPPIEGAIEGIQKLSVTYNIVIATSRESCTDSWSREWLNNHSVPYERFINTRSEGKILDGTDILIDDYIENIRKFLSNGTQKRRAILFAQPRNSDVNSIRDLIESGRVKIAHSWEAVLAILGCGSLAKAMQASANDEKVPAYTRGQVAARGQNRLYDWAYIVGTLFEVILLIAGCFLIRADSDYIRMLKFRFVTANLAAIGAYTAAFWWAQNRILRSILFAVILFFIAAMIFELLSLVILAYPNPQ